MLSQNVRKIISLYQKGLSTRAVGSILGIDNKTVSYHLKKNGIALRDRNKARIKIKDEMIPKVLSLYQSGLSSATVAKIFNVSEPTILKVIHKKKALKKHPRRIYKVNDESFSKLTNEVIYWIGFLMADGYVGKNYLCLTLSKKDQKHLLSFKNFLQAENPINKVRIKRKTKKGSKVYHAVSLKIRSKKILTRIKTFGVVNNKSLTAKAFKNVHTHASFWTGVIDGDGCLCWDKSKKLPILSLCGSKYLIPQFIDFCSKYFVDFSPYIYKRKTLWVVNYYGQRAIFLIKKFYKWNFCLQRKKEKARKFVNLYSRRFHHGPVLQNL